MQALKFIVTCKEIFLNSAYFRQSELRSMQADLERMKATQRKEQIVIELEVNILFYSYLLTILNCICLLNFCINMLFFSSLLYLSCLLFYWLVKIMHIQKRY